MKNMFDTCRSCVICGENNIIKNKLLYGNAESNILIIGSAIDHIKFNQNNDIFMYLDANDILSNYSLTFTTKCVFEDIKNRNEYIDNCALFSRILTNSFTHFILCKEAFNQLNIGDLGINFIVELWQNTPYGYIYCIEEIFDMPNVKNYTIPDSDLVKNKRGIIL